MTGSGFLMRGVTPTFRPRGIGFTYPARLSKPRGARCALLRAFAPGSAVYTTIMTIDRILILLGVVLLLVSAILAAITWL